MIPRDPGARAPKPPPPRNDDKNEDGEFASGFPGNRRLWRQPSASNSKDMNERSHSHAMFPPPPEEGVNRWIMLAAWGCRRGGLSRKHAVETIRASEPFLRNGRKFRRNEIEKAVEKAYADEPKDTRSNLGSSVSRQTRGARKETPRIAERRRIPSMKKNGAVGTPRWNEAETARIHGELNFDPAMLFECSPDAECLVRDADSFIDRLFPGNPLLCVADETWKFRTRPREEFRGMLGSKQFIVPCVMTAVHGRTKAEGNLSEHTLENTGPRSYIVLDLDDPPFEQHASIIWHLSRYAPLVLALHSGGKGLHAWYRTMSEEADERFWRYAASLGADPKLWKNRSQFVRMPGGTRSNGRRQYVVYFNPGNCAKSD